MRKMGGGVDSRLRDLSMGPSACAERSCRESRNATGGVCRRKRGRWDREALCRQFLFLFSPQRNGSARLSDVGRVLGTCDPGSPLPDRKESGTFHTHKHTHFISVTGSKVKCTIVAQINHRTAPSCQATCYTLRPAARV